MTTFKEFVPAAAAVLRLDPATVNVAAMALRAAGFLSSEGRGRPPATMKPADAANLLLGLVASAHAPLKETPALVARLRAARLFWVERNGEYLGTRPEDCPAADFLAGPSGPRTFGEVLDAMMAELSQNRCLLAADMAEITNYSLSVRVPGVFTTLELWTGPTTRWTLKFRHMERGSGTSWIVNTSEIQARSISSVARALGRGWLDKPREPKRRRKGKPDE